tara:strand:+ start:1429 stop:5916 length:4488 start_codon:yes stop_codon:yes gene_type:complete
MPLKLKNSRFKIYLRKTLKWLSIILLFLLLVSYLIFKSSYVQTFICKKIGNSLSEKTGTTITVKEVDFRPFDTFVLKDLLILDHQKDTMVFTRDFYFEINDYDLKKLDFKLDLVELNDALINIKTYKDEEQSNLIQFIGKLSQRDSLKKTKIPEITIREVEFEQLSCKIWNENIPVNTNRIDFNHLELFEIDMDAKNFSFKKNSIKVNTKLLAFKEKSGFELLGMSGELNMNSKELIMQYLEIETNETDINGDVRLSYENFNAFNNFFTEVTLDTYFKETKISSKDVAYFVNTLKGLNQSITFQGNINGTTNQLNAKQLKFSYGDLTHFDGEIKFDGLGTVKDPVINAKITNLVTFEKDIKNIPLPPFNSGRKIKTPNWMGKVGKMEFKGDFTGPASNFEATGLLKTNAGSIKADVFFKSDSADETKIVGKVITKEFDLGKTIGNPNFGLISMNGQINALAQFDNNRLIFSGEIPRIDYKEYSYSNITMDGTVRDKVFNGMLAVKDDNLIFDFDGSIDFSVPKLQKYNFVAELKQANLRNINWSARDSSTQISAKLKVNMIGDKFEDLNGDLSLKDLVWKENGVVYKVDSFNLNSVKREEREMMILKSDIMHAKIEGKYNLDEIYPTVMNVFSKEIPSIVKSVKLKGYRGGNSFNIMFKLHNYDIINKLFTPNFNLSKRTRLSGRFDDNIKSFNLNFEADSVFINNRVMRNVKLYSNNHGDKLNIVGRSKFIQIVNNLGAENIKLNSTIENNSLNYSVSYKNNSENPSYGNVSGTLNLHDLDSIKLNFSQSNFVHQDTVWKIDTTAFVCIADNYIYVRDFSLHAKNQFLKIHGKSSMEDAERMVFKMQNFQLNTIGYLWKSVNLNLQGIATGSLILNGGFSNQLFATDLTVTDMKLNQQHFGKLKLNTFSKKSNKIIDVTLTIANKKNKLNNLLIKGYYYPYENGRIEMNANLRNTELKFLEAYFDGVFSDFKGGKTSGDLAIEGTIRHPVFKGDLTIDHLRFSVDYLNVTYGIDGQKLKFDKDFIWFNSFTLTHDLHPKSKASINGFVNLNGFKNITYQMDSVFLEQFFCLNTTVKENSTYYGQAYVDGLLQFRGNGKTNFIGGSVSTTNSTKFDVFKEKYIPVSTTLELPLDEAKDLEISEFASFVNLSETKTNDLAPSEKFNVSGLDLDFNFKINPESNVRILFDPAVGDEINARGNGSIGMMINSNGKFNIYGDFSVTRGNYFFTLQNIIGKKFIVEPGSKISWNGDPLDAQIEMKTYYKSRANLINLVDSIQDSDYNNLKYLYDNRIQVHSNLLLFGSLWKPSLKIGIYLPDGTPEEKDFLKEKVYGEDEINRQAFSLILTSQFLPPSSGVESIVSDKAGLHNGMQFVEGQINNALNGLLHPNLDLGVDYNEVEESESDENLTKDELRLLAGFKYKNLSFKTDYDINNQVGDIEAEFKITEALKAKAYHKTTTDATALNNQITTSYGLGASYQKSFDSIKDLFKKKKDKK